MSNILCFKPDDTAFILFFLQRCVLVPSDCSVSTLHHLLNVKLRTALLRLERHNEEDQLRCFRRTINAPVSCIVAWLREEEEGGVSLGVWHRLVLMTLAIGRHLDSLCNPIYWASDVQQPCRLDRRDVSAECVASMICCAGCSGRTSRSLSSVDRIGDN